MYPHHGPHLWHGTCTSFTEPLGRYMTTVEIAVAACRKKCQENGRRPEG